MEEILIQYALDWAAPYLSFAMVWIVGGLTIAGVVNVFATGVLRPLAKLTSSPKDDVIVARLVWWSDAVADVMRLWSTANWKGGWDRPMRIRADYKKPLAKRRTD